MAEVYALRQELEEVRQRAGYLEQLADQDTLAPVLNRRAFIRELGRMAAFEERYGAAGAVLYFDVNRSEEHTSELQSLMRISYAVFCLKKKNKKNHIKLNR